MAFLVLGLGVPRVGDVGGRALGRLVPSLGCGGFGVPCVGIWGVRGFGVPSEGDLDACCWVWGAGDVGCLVWGLGHLVLGFGCLVRGFEVLGILGC